MCNLMALNGLWKPARVQLCVLLARWRRKSNTARRPVNCIAVVTISTVWNRYGQVQIRKSCETAIMQSRLCRYVILQETCYVQFDGSQWLVATCSSAIMCTVIPRNFQEFSRNSQEFLGISQKFLGISRNFLEIPRNFYEIPRNSQEFLGNSQKFLGIYRKFLEIPRNL